MHIKVSIYGIALLMLVACACAQSSSSDERFMADMGRSMKAMDRGMATAPMDGNVDHDFASMMLPHHQGAIDMAKAELLYGKDPVMRRMAQGILVEQQSEMEAMNLWLSKRPR